MNRYKDYPALDIEVKDAVATIRMLSMQTLVELAEAGVDTENHFELGSALTRLREDDSVRVVVITGVEDGAPLHMSGTPSDDAYVRRRKQPPGVHLPDPVWRGLQGVRMTHNAIAEMEKPVVMRLNGDAIGFAQSLMFCCDLIIAWEGARIVDNHMGIRGVDRAGSPLGGIVPGDGGAALVPLHMPPAMAMEYLLLAKEYTAAELAQRGIVNYAVPMEALDAKVDEIVQSLLKRSAYALAFSKRVAKRRLVDQLNLALDAGIGYEWVNILHVQGSGKVADRL